MNNSLPIPCGKECPDRSPTCHGECEKYAEFVRLNELRKAGKLEKLETDYALWSQRVRIKEKKRRSHRKK